MKKLALVMIMTATLFVGAIELSTGTTTLETSPTYTQAYLECMAICISPGNECHELCSEVARNKALGTLNPR